jgi:DNA-binding NtrC family response regulator
MAHRETPDLPGGDGERILVVDDEAAVLRLCRKLFESLGYRVTAESAPGAALSKFLDSPEAFDLVITDLKSSGMSGACLAEAIAEVRPDLPVIAHTGGSPLPSEIFAIRRVVLKPAGIRELARAVRSVLDQPEPVSRQRFEQSAS